MSLIAEATIGSPIFERALSTAPEVELVVEDIRLSGEERTRFICWARGEHFEAFESGLAADPTVEDVRPLADSEDAKMYRLTLSDAGVAASTYQVAVEHDIVIVELRFTTSGLHAMGRIQDRESLVAYRQACRDAGIEFRLERLYSEASAGGGADLDERFGVTAPQRAALTAALEMGYFEVPRRASLEEVAEELDITAQALSTRLRRGHTNLVRNALS